MSEPENFALKLYVAGQTPKAMRAFANLRKICDEHLAGRYSIEVIDLVENPQLGRGDQILALPTLVRRLPTPIKKIIGDLSNTERVLVGLDLRPRGPDVNKDPVVHDNWRGLTSRPSVTCCVSM